MAAEDTVTFTPSPRRELEALDDDGDLFYILARRRSEPTTNDDFPCKSSDQGLTMSLQ